MHADITGTSRLVIPHSLKPRERALVYDKLQQPKMAASALIAVGQAREQQAQV